MTRIAMVLGIVLLLAVRLGAQTPVVYSQSARTTVAWTSATAVNTTTAVSIQNLSTVTVALNATTTMTGGVLTFERSDTAAGTIWYAMQCARDAALGTADTTFTLSVVNQSWSCPVAGWNQFRVRLSTVITGSGTANVAIYPTAAPIAQVASVGVTNGSTTVTDGTTITAGNTNVAETASVLYAFDGTANRRLQADTNGDLKDNIVEFGGNAVVTGTGASGNGIPRVTVSNDSSLTGTLTNNGAAATGNRIATLPGVAQTSYVNGTAYTQGRDAAPDVFTDGSLHVASLPAMRPASYTASSGFAGSSTTDNAVLPGNATNTVLVTDIVVTCTQTTAGSLHLQIIKRSAADTGGTSATMTVVPDDSNYAAGSSAPLSYTGTGPSAGAAVGNIDDAWIGCNATATAGPNDVYVGNFHMKPIVLRGTAQQVAVNFSNAAITGGNITVRFKWIETASITP